VAVIRATSDVSATFAPGVDVSQHGPTPGARCTVCRHTRVRDADDMLRNGKSVASVARFLGLARRDAVDRHVKAGHVAPAVAPATPGGATSATPTGNPTTAEAQIRAIVASLDAIDVARLAPAAQIALFGERRRAAEALSRVAKTPPSEVEIDVPGDHPRGIRDFVGALFQTLEVAPCEACGHMNGPALRATLHQRMVEAGLIEKTLTREEFYAAKRGPPVPPEETTR
jgi:hypothetical protein